MGEAAGRKSAADAVVTVAAPPPAAVPMRLRAWRGVLILGLSMTACLAWMPHQLAVMPDQSDKLKHAMAFASLGLAAWHACPDRRLRAFLMLLGFGLLIELVQAALPTRSAEAADLLADAAGLAFAALVGRLGPLWGQRRRAG